MNVNEIAVTPEPPYYAATFTSFLKGNDLEGYYKTAERMLQLASQQPGFLGYETVRGENGLGITISYWESREAITNWKANIEHREVQGRGFKDWYQKFTTRICRVESQTSFEADSQVAEAPGVMGSPT